MKKKEVKLEGKTPLDTPFLAVAIEPNSITKSHLDNTLYLLAL